jgi:hypothetical protein
MTIDRLATLGLSFREWLEHLRGQRHTGAADGRLSGGETS